MNIACEVDMKLSVLVIMVVLLPKCLAQGPLSAAPALSPAEHALIGKTKMVMEAERSKDLETLKRVLTDDFQQVASDAKMHGKDDALDDAREGNLKDYALYDFKVLPVDDNVAIVTYDTVIQMPEGDDGLAPRYQHFSDVWVKQGDQWRLRFQQATARRSID
jgi:hypothetical protein